VRAVAPHAGTLRRRMSPRRPLALLLAVVLCAGLVACGSDDSAGSGSSTTPTGPQRKISDIDVAAPTDLKTKPSVGIPDGKPPAGLQQADLVEGEGAAAKKGDKLKVKYVGLAWSTGQEFDASWDRGDTIDVELGAGNVIQGWDRGLVGMKVGGRRVLSIPPSLGYGEQGQPPSIAPNETLVFVVDLASLTPAKS
jgi:peptidylprolyl isomerase